MPISPIPIDGPVLVLGAGLDGAAVAWGLARRGASVIVVDERDLGSVVIEEERYAAWWPGADDAVTRLAGRGADLLEQLCAEPGKALGINRRGHLFVASRPAPESSLRSLAGRLVARTGGQLREHATTEWYLPSPANGVRGVPDGIDLLEGAALRTVFPFLGSQIHSGLHVRRAGWVDGGALRARLAESAGVAGVQFLSGRVRGVDRSPSEGWSVRLDSGERVTGGAIVVTGSGRGGLARRVGLVEPGLDATWLVARLAGAAPLLPATAPVIVPSDDLALPANPRSLRGGGTGDLVIETTLLGTPAPGTALSGEDLFRELAATVPLLGGHRGPAPRLSARATPLWLSPDGRPMIGMTASGMCVVRGVSGAVNLSLGAGDLVGDLLMGGEMPPWAASLAPARFEEYQLLRGPGIAGRAPVDF